VTTTQGTHKAHASSNGSSPAHLSLVIFVLPAVMEDAITLPTEIAAMVAQNQSFCLPIIVVVTERLHKHITGAMVIARY